MGPTMGEGRLTLLDGTAHAFSVSGLNLQGHVGSSVDLEAKGEVYNLQRLGCRCRNLPAGHRCGGSRASY